MRRQIRFSIWFPIVLVAAFAAGYLFWQQTLLPGPYDVEPMNIVRNGWSNLPRDEVLRGWQTYRNEQYGFEVKYPKNWYQMNYPTGAKIWTFQSAPVSENLHGSGIPSLGNMWAEIAQGICNNPTTDFIYEGPKPDILEKTVCKNNFQVTLGLWQKDQNLTEHKKILNQILSTFRFIR